MAGGAMDALCGRPSVGEGQRLQVAGGAGGGPVTGEARVVEHPPAELDLGLCHRIVLRDRRRRRPGRHRPAKALRPGRAGAFAGAGRRDRERGDERHAPEGELEGHPSASLGAAQRTVASSWGRAGWSPKGRPSRGSTVAQSGSSGKDMQPGLVSGVLVVRSTAAITRAGSITTTFVARSKASKRTVTRLGLPQAAVGAVVGSGGCAERRSEVQEPARAPVPCGGGRGGHGRGSLRSDLDLHELISVPPSPEHRRQVERRASEGLVAVVEIEGHADLKGEADVVVVGRGAAQGGVCLGRSVGAGAHAVLEVD